MEELIAIGAVVGVVWGAAIMLRGGLMAGCLVVMLAGSCFGAAFFSVPMSPLPLTIDRVLFGLLLVQYACYRRLGLADPKPLRFADYALAAFLLMLLISTLTHNWQVRNNAPLALVTFFYLMPAAMYWIGRQMQLTVRALLAVSAFLALLGVYLGATAIAEAQQINSVVFPGYIVSPNIIEFLGRARGPFLNPAANGVFLATCLGALLMWWPRVGRLGQLMLLGGALIILGGAYSTLTRSVWMGAGLALMVLAALTLPRAWRGAVLATVLIGGAAIAATNLESILLLKRDKNLSAEASADSAALRPILATVAWHMWQDQPLIGHGYGQYIEARRPYLADRGSSELPLEKVRPYIQHNVLLAMLVDTGVLGAGLLLLVFGCWTRDAWKLWTSRAAPLAVRQHGLIVLMLIASYSVNGMFHDLSIMSMIHMLLFFMAGISSGLLAECREASAASPNESRVWQWLPQSAVAR